MRSKRKDYVEAVVKKAREERHDDEGTVEEKQKAMRIALVDTVVETLGRTMRSQHDWFLDFEDYIRPSSG